MVGLKNSRPIFPIIWRQIFDQDFTNSANTPSLLVTLMILLGENTNGKINQVITADDLETDTVTLLANALISRDWTHPFSKPGEDF